MLRTQHLVTFLATTVTEVETDLDGAVEATVAMAVMADIQAVTVAEEEEEATVAEAVVVTEVVAVVAVTAVVDAELNINNNTNNDIKL